MSALPDEKKEPASPLSRRDFLSVSLAAGGGMLIGFPLSAFAQTTPGKYELRPNAFIRIDPDNRIAFIIPQEEMGQGVYTSLSQLLADELDVGLDHVTPEPAPPSDTLYGQPGGGGQGTGGSTSIRAFYWALRRVGASARAMLVEAAAQAWRVEPSSLRTENGQVIDDTHHRRLDYGALAARAAKLPAPQNPPLKADKDLKLVGRSVKRLDTPDKVNGKAQFGIDVRLPGLKVATLMAAPTVGGRIAAVDEAQAMQVKGVRRVVVLDDLVAVVGDHFWAARQGLIALNPRWYAGVSLSSPEILAELEEIAARPGAVASNQGDVEQGLSAGMRLDAVYQVPFLAHAPMEPMNFTVHVKDGGCEMWGGSQVQASAQGQAAKTLKLPQDKIVFHNMMLGGGFGRRLDTDMVEKAVRIGAKADGPVKVIWTREEDMRQDMVRPAYRNVMAAAVNGEGRITAWTHRVAGGSVMARMFGPGSLKKGVDEDALDGALNTPYDIPARRIEYAEAEPKALRVGWWRGVAPNNTVFAAESLMDELAKKLGQDPIRFRIAHLGKSPRLAAALRLAAEKSGWGTPLPSRHGRGVGAQFVFGTYMATVAHVSVEENGEVRVHRLTSAVDAGRVVNPDTLAAQIQGGLIFGLTAALYDKITVKDGRVEQGNFNDYRMMRMGEAPQIDVHIIESGEAPGGIGEPGCTAGPPALINAIAAASGIRLRQLPVDRDVLAGRRSV